MSSCNCLAQTSGYVNQHPNYQTTACKTKIKLAAGLLLIYQLTANQHPDTCDCPELPPPTPTHPDPHIPHPQTGLADQRLVLLSVMAQAEAPASLPLSVISCQKQTGVCLAGSLRPSLCSIRVHMQGSEVGWPPLTPSLFLQQDV